ncbi:MAG TPA: hypothetical protein VGK71_06525 [Nitrospirota bacterium]
MYFPDLNSMIGKEVEVDANETTYRGRLIEVSEDDVFLQSELGWIQLVTASVTDIRLTQGQ